MYYSNVYVIIYTSHGSLFDGKHSFFEDIGLNSSRFCLYEYFGRLADIKNN